MPLEAIFFDVDDTLFDRRGAQGKALQLIARQLPELFSGIADAELKGAFLRSDELSMQQYGPGTPAATLRRKRSTIFLELLGLDRHYCDAITELYVEQYPKVDAPVKGARQLVQQLAGQFKLGIISNGLADVQYTKLDTLGLRTHFASILLSDEVGIEKPHRAIFTRGLEQLQTQPQRALYVGDSFANDVVGANNAGMWSCWFNPDADPIPPNQAAPDFTISTLAALPDHIKSTA